MNNATCKESSIKDNKVEPIVFNIHSSNIYSFRANIAKLSKKATKLGLPAPVVKELGEQKKKKQDGEIYLVYKVEIDPGFAEIKVNGWDFVATVQHTEEGNIIRNVGNSEVPPKYRTVDAICEHCNQIRNRKDTYILYNDETKQYKQVGRTCLQDFLGHNALQYAARAEYLTLINDLGMDGEKESGGRGPSFYDLEYFLSIVATLIKSYGWVSRKKASEIGQPATADDALAALFSVGNKMQHTEEDKELAAKTIEWAENIEGETISDYLSNVRTIARRGVVEHRDAGLAASMISAYNRYLEDIRKQSRLAESKYIGTIGDKVTVKVVIDKILAFDGHYGRSFLHLMTDDAGNSLTWSTGESRQVGESLVLHGTIKAHKDYKGAQQTVLTRCKVIELKKFVATVDGEKHVVEADTLANAKKILKEKLGKLPRGLLIEEELSP